MINFQILKKKYSNQKEVSHQHVKALVSIIKNFFKSSKKAIGLLQSLT